MLEITNEDAHITTAFKEADKYKTQWKQHLYFCTPKPYIANMLKIKLKHDTYIDKKKPRRSSQVTKIGTKEPPSYLTASSEQQEKFL